MQKTTLTFNELPLAVSELRDDIIWIKEYLKHKDSSDPQSPSQDKFLTVPEAAAFLGLATQTVYGLISRKQIPSMKRQKRVYFSRNELTDWIQSGRRMTSDEITASARPVWIKKGGAK